MRFAQAYGGWQERRLTQEEAALGVCERTFRRSVDRYEADVRDPPGALAHTLSPARSGNLPASTAVGRKPRTAPFTGVHRTFAGATIARVKTGVSSECPPHVRGRNDCEGEDGRQL